MNHLRVNEVLVEFSILPLNSPVYYASYHGATQGSGGKRLRLLHVTRKNA